MEVKEKAPSLGGNQGQKLKSSSKDTTKNPFLKVSSRSSSLFKVQTANKFINEAKSRPQTARLFGDFFREGELCFMFGDTNTGKSIVAVQIGEALAINREIWPFVNESHHSQKVLYFDFELSDKQFQNRYTDIHTGDIYHFSDNFLRAEIDADAITDITDGISENFLYQQFEKSIISSDAKVVIVDNITYLKHETEKSRNALPLMKMLKLLKQKHGLSLLVIAHTPKRDITRPITRNDLGGSKMLINFADSCFAIGESTKDPAIRYIKQIKARDSEIVFHADKVAVFQIQKPDCFLHFDLMTFSTENEHLKFVGDPEREHLKEEAAKLNAEGKSYRQIGEELFISKSKAYRLINE